jgi:hypothetical protein
MKVMRKLLPFNREERSAAGGRDEFTKIVYPATSPLEMTLAQAKNVRSDKFHKLIATLEKKRKSRIFSIIQCDDRDGDEGICARTFAHVFDGRTGMAHVPVLELLLESPGGDADVAYTLMQYFRRHCDKLNVIVPLFAKSAATLMALGADAIYMGEFADLGPIDVQMKDPLKKGVKVTSPLDEFKSAEFLRDYTLELMDSFTMLILKRSGMSIQEAMHESIPLTIGIMRPLYEQIDPLVLGEHQRSLAIGDEYAKRLMQPTRNPKQKEIVKALLSKYPSHSFVIDFEEARGLGLPVHRLKHDEENLFLEAVNCIRATEESYHGFSKEPAKKPATPSKKREAGGIKRPPASISSPTPAEAKK